MTDLPIDTSQPIASIFVTYHGREYHFQAFDDAISIARQATGSASAASTVTENPAGEYDGVQAWNIEALLSLIRSYEDYQDVVIRIQNLEANSSLPPPEPSTLPPVQALVVLVNEFIEADKTYAELMETSRLIDHYAAFSGKVERERFSQRAHDARQAILNYSATVNEVERHALETAIPEDFVPFHEAGALMAKLGNNGHLTHRQRFEVMLVANKKLNRAATKADPLNRQAQFAAFVIGFWHQHRELAAQRRGGPRSKRK